jgi:hypothetical protein
LSWGGKTQKQKTKNKKQKTKKKHWPGRAFVFSCTVHHYTKNKKEALLFFHRNTNDLPQFQH